jgi:hypothetical protein
LSCFSARASPHRFDSKAYKASRRAQWIFEGALRDDFPLVCEMVGSSGDSAVSRLVDDPRLILQSLQTVASKLGQG